MSVWRDEEFIKQRQEQLTAEALERVADTKAELFASRRRQRLPVSGIEGQSEHDPSFPKTEAQLIAEMVHSMGRIFHTKGN